MVRFRIGIVLSGALVVAAVAFALFPLIRETWHAFALVAGSIARTDNPGTFTRLFLLNALTFLVFVGVLQLVPSPRHREEHREPGRYADIARNRVFLCYIVLNIILIGAGIAAMSELLPPFEKTTAHVSEPAIGAIWFVFAAGVALGQLPVVKLVEGKRRLRGPSAARTLHGVFQLHVADRLLRRARGRRLRPPPRPWLSGLPRRPSVSWRPSMRWRWSDGFLHTST